MKRQVQEIGIRRWFGDDFIGLQNELYEALEGFFEPYGNMIIKGCLISDIGGSWQIAVGLVGLYSPTGDEYRVCRVAQTDVLDANAAVYLTLTSETTTRAYKTGGSKTVVKEYKALISTVQPGSGEYLTINANGNNVTFREGLQNAIYRFVTDTEKATWNAKEPAITKKTGFNKDKSDSVSSTSTDTLATSAAARTAYNRGSTGVTDAANALSVANAGVADAATALAAANSKLAATAQAVDSAKLGGQLPSYYSAAHSHPYLGATEKAVDSDKLDGLDNSAFAKVGSTNAFSQPQFFYAPRSDDDAIVARFIHRASVPEVGAQIYLGGHNTNDSMGVKIVGYSDPSSNHNGRMEILTSSEDGVWNKGLTQDKDGRVGIGKNAGEKLDVNGNVRATDFIIL